MNSERYVPEEAFESRHPFNKKLEELKEGEDFDIHKLGEPRTKIELPSGEERDFDKPEYAVTEYFDEGGKNHEEFVRLKKFYEAAQEELGDLLPKAMFVEGEPSDPSTGGRSFYVVQKFNNPEFNQQAKALDELNRQEFSVDFLNQLLAIQERINTFLKNHQGEIPEGWVDSDLFNPRKFKEDILHYSEANQTQIINMFRLNPELAKQAIGSEGKFETDRFKALKMIGLASLIEKIEWAFERSQAKEWIAGRNVHWKLDAGKMKQLEKEGKKVMALTFDDGPNKETEHLLDILKEEGVKATFFLVGSQIAGREHIVRRIVAEGHDIGNHEWAQEGELSSDIKNYDKYLYGPRNDMGDVVKTNALIEQVTGQKPTLARIAGVHGSLESIREFEKLKVKIVHGYWKDVFFMPPKRDMTSEKLLSRALKFNGHGRIRIFHIGKIEPDGHALRKDELKQGEVYPPEETLKMIQEFIQKSREQGYDFVKVEDNIK